MRWRKRHFLTSQVATDKVGQENIILYLMQIVLGFWMGFKGFMVLIDLITYHKSVRSKVLGE